MVITVCKPQSIIFKQLRKRIAKCQKILINVLDRCKKPPPNAISPPPARNDLHFRLDTIDMKPENKALVKFLFLQCSEAQPLSVQQSGRLAWLNGS